MKTTVRKHQVTIDDVTVPLNVANGSGCYLEIVQAAKRQLDAMLSYHGDVFVMYFIVQLPTYTADNTPISQLTRSLRKRLESKPAKHASRQSKKRYQFSRVGFVWAREQEHAAAQHYHVALMLDGKQVQHPKYILQEYLKPAADRLGLKISLCSQSGRVKRNDEELYGVCLKRISYSAKERGKGAREKKAKDFGSSHLKAKADTVGNCQPSSKQDAEERRHIGSIAHVKASGVNAQGHSQQEGEAVSAPADIAKLPTQCVSNTRDREAHDVPHKAEPRSRKRHIVASDGIRGPPRQHREPPATRIDSILHGGQSRCTT
ncbi:YagK/YfjJ domain-containing protein [Halovibrio sp. HP20-50]|uniref:YagK/YfjJ domain-containing protein n=1 Tax=Halovibrio sp. HP20-59 TaxID=3080275 RepID=UPI00294AA0D0|nr:inovirus-type Gp2 protein [Halovibrio sp. HP20-59]MEA2119746.1 inovirus-type Gp2 protein [Halovibrio sp. HP20-59]